MLHFSSLGHGQPTNNREGNAAQSIQTVLHSVSRFILCCVGKYDKTRSTSPPIPLLFIAFSHKTSHRSNKRQRFEAPFPPLIFKCGLLGNNLELGG